VISVDSEGGEFTQNSSENDGRARLLAYMYLLWCPYPYGTNIRRIRRNLGWALIVLIRPDLVLIKGR